MPSFREIKGRIAGVRNIQQITRAMKMVAGARLRRAEQAIYGLRPFASRLDGTCARFLREAIGGEHPFFEQRPPRTAAVLCATSDRGLCGSYNNRVIEAVAGLKADKPNRRLLVISVGRRGTARLRGVDVETIQAYEDVFNPLRYVTSMKISAELRRLFIEREADEVLVVATHYYSPLRQVVGTRRLLPCPPETAGRHIEDARGGVPDRDRRADEADKLREAADDLYLFEPGYEAICNRLLEYNMDVQVYRNLLEAQASEHGARMMAMDNATRNADDMIDDLTLRMNRLRQESITAEILDVIGGSEAVP